MRYRVEYDQELGRELQGDDGLLSRWKFQRIQSDLLDDALEVRWQVDAGAPEHLPAILPDRKLLRIVRRYAADARAHRERDLDHLVERRFVAGSAQGAPIFVPVERLQRRARVEDAAAAGAEDVPGQLEQPKARGMQEGGDEAFLVHAEARRQIQDVDSIEVPVGRFLNETLDRFRRHGSSALAQDGEKRLTFAHVPDCSPVHGREKADIFGNGSSRCAHFP